MFTKAHRSFTAFFALITILGMLAIKPIQPVLASTLLITNTNDSGAGSLRQAIVNASPGDTITFHASLSGQTITLVSTLVIDKNLTIDGSTLPSRINVSGNNSTRVFEVPAGISAELNHLTIKSGYHDDSGGGIDNSGTLTLTNAYLLQNAAGYYGGAIFNRYTGTLNILHSMIAVNSANRGGGIYNSGTLTLTDSTLEENSASYRGAGIYNQEILAVTNSTLFWNEGGGIFNVDRLTVINSNISENLFDYGIYSFDGTSTVTNSTVSWNDHGGILIQQGTLAITSSTIASNLGSYGVVNQGDAELIITNSILYDHSAEEIYSPGSTPVVTYSIIQGGYVGTGNLNVDPLLGSLADNGGPTQTIALLSGSPAIDAGDDATCPNTDQRGVIRPQGAHCDIGAYEVSSTFTDVPLDHWSWRYIEGLYNAGVTSGCSTSPLMYCPATTVTRDQMAVFLLRAKHGSSYTPPAATGVFQDVPTNYWAAAWIEQLAAEGITGGCSVTPKLYCPTTPVTRDQMAVFLLRAEHGSSYSPPAATGVFQDVPTNHWAASWIERLAVEGITGGCSLTPSLYCPATPVTRDQMAVFLVRTFGLATP